MDLYQKYHEKGLEVLGFTRDDLLKSLQGSSEEFKKDERVQGLLSHRGLQFTQRRRVTAL